MGVTGLWRLIEPAGKPVPVETLENKVLAIDISIWLHQVVKGYQDAKGAPMPNAHLIGLFQRVCKLLYFRIKPIFVFDGAFPELKKETIAKRSINKAKYNSESERLRREIILLLGKRTAIGALIGNTSPTKIPKHNSSHDSDDMFKLPALPESKEESDIESEEDESSSSSVIDLHSVDIEAEQFKMMPVKEKYDLLIELKETRKMNSWGRLHELPKKSDNFSDFQMQRLLKRRKVQEVLEETEKEMGGNSLSLNELESLLNEEGINTEIQSLPSNRIASNDTTRFVLIKDVKQTLENLKRQQLEKEQKMLAAEAKPSTSKIDNTERQLTDTDDVMISDSKRQCAIKKHMNVSEETEADEDLQKAIQMSLECVNEPNESICTSSKTDNSANSTFTYESDYSGSEEDDAISQPDMAAAKAYLMQYSDFTHKTVKSLVSSEIKSTKDTKSKVDKILEELDNETTVIADVINLDDSVSVSSEKENKSSDSLKQGNDSSQSNILLDTSKKDDFHNKSNENIDSEKANKHTDSLQLHDSSGINVMVNTLKDDTTNKTDLNYFSSSIVANSPERHVIEVNTSEDDKSNPNVNIASSLAEDLDSEDSDSEFEDVSAIEAKDEAKMVIELNLNMGKAPDDDIFADIFTEDSVKLPEKYENSKSFSKDEEEVNSEKLDRPLGNLITNKSPVDPEKRAEVSNERPIESKHSATNSADLINNIHLIEKEHEISQSVELNKTDELSKDTVGNKNDSKNTVDANKTDEDLETKDGRHKNVINEELKEKLQNLADAIQIEEEDMIQEKSKLDRMGRNISEQMTKEVQELLQIFGIPYIVAPMEAEAQCAFLETVKLTDGTITDDSDIWLFGGRTVYKNFFNQHKHVKQFVAERIEKSFNLNREQLILLALLVGSDYTTGIPGVGPVTALEILASFPYSKKELQAKTSEQARYICLLSGLLEFKNWVKAGRRTDNTSLKKKLRNIDLTDDFPSIRVVQAYLEPRIEKSEEAFTWGQPDTTILCDYAKSKFGWSQNKFEEMMKPVLKRMQDRKSQKTVYDYFKRKIEFQSLEEHMSKRVRAAVNKMGPETQSNEDGDTVNEKPTTSKIRKPRKVRKKRVNETDTVESTKEIVNTPVDEKISMVKIKVDDFQEVNKPTEVSTFEINVPKLNRYQEIIPQREKDMQNILKNKLKAIEVFRKTKIDTKCKRKRKVPLPKDKAELSESSDSD